MVIEDKQSTEWLRIKGYCTSRIAELREENDTDLSMEETIKIRGMLEFAKEIIELDKVERKPDVVDTNYM